MARFKTNPWELDQLLSILDSCKLVLPEFQRSFVWRATDIDLLLTSLVQDFPAGSLLFLRAGAAEQELAWRPVEGAKTNGQVTPDYLVLDGQQRLTSLSLALNGRGEHLFFMDLQLLDQGAHLACRAQRAPGHLAGHQHDPRPAHAGDLGTHIAEAGRSRIGRPAGGELGEDAQQPLTGHGSAPLTRTRVASHMSRSHLRRLPGLVR